MALLDRMFADDEELGKKDDDHRPGKGTALSSSWAPRQSIPAFRRRRLFYGLLAILCVYLFIKNISTDLAPDSRRGDGSTSVGSHAPALRPKAPSGQPPRPTQPSEAEQHYYEGQIKFYNLAVSLHAVEGLAGYNGANKNVLFAASSLKSVSEILPLACEMAKWERNDVHFAVMGRDDLDVSEIKKLNGVDDDCKINWHDARPDYSRWSSNWRMEVSITASLGHIQMFVHPQVIITDHRSREDAFFIKAIRAKAVIIDKSVIELPPDALENLMWITRLDSSSLAAWHTTYVDLVIHVPPKSSGSLIWLLKSIEGADYFGCRRPHITIELPAEVDPPTSEFLEAMVWPPLDGSGAQHASQVSLRHRISRHVPLAGEASAHLIESFYPARPKDSHVLLVSPQTELSPIYYHFLMYNLLEYRYSTFGQRTHESKDLMGFSLELPSTYLNESTNLEPPTLDSANGKRSSREDNEPTPFLWQAPNSNAALYFGDKWVELHSFLSARTYLQDPLVSVDHRPPLRPKLISKSYPSWLEYVQELMRARGYFLLYPHFPNADDAVVTVHNELKKAPEEYSKTTSHSPSTAVPTLDPSDPFTTDPSAHVPILPTRSEVPLLRSNLLSVLPDFGKLSELTHLPLLSHDGNILSEVSSLSNALEFAGAFRREIGGCIIGDRFIVEPMTAKDLFCSLDKADDKLEPKANEEKGSKLVADTSESENAKSSEASDIQENAGDRPEDKAQELKPKEIPANDAAVDKSVDIQDEFKRHLQRQGKSKEEKAAAAPPPGGMDDDSVETPKEELKIEPESDSNVPISDVAKTQNDNKTSKGPKVTTKDNGETPEPPAEPVEKPNDPELIKESGQAALVKVSKGVKGKKQRSEETTTKEKAEETFNPVDTRPKEATTKEGGEDVRDRGW